MEFNLEINLHKGFGSFNFGQTVTEAIQLFGEPEETQTLDDEILNTSAYVMHYWTQGFSLFFDVLNNKSFSSVESDNQGTTLFGQKIFKLSEKELIALMLSNGFKLSETEQHSWGEKRLSFDEAGLDCYFENSRLSSINFGVITPDEKFAYFPN